MVRAEVTPDSTSIRVSWQWSRQGLLMCVYLVRVHYQPEGGSLMMYTVNNTTATSATLPNLQCNAKATKYTITLYASSLQINRTSATRMVSLPARGIHRLYSTVRLVVVTGSFRIEDKSQCCKNNKLVWYSHESNIVISTIR